MNLKPLLLSVVFFINISANAQLFPRVDKPATPEASLLVLQFAHDDAGAMRNVLNTNFTGWAPAVKGPDGKIVPFRSYDAASGFTNIYYSENLAAGEYTLVGFYHVYTDYGKLKDYEAQIGRQHLPSYEPFADKPYHIKQLFELAEPVKVTLEPNKVVSLGSYAVTYKWVSGASGTTDDRWKMVDGDTKITLSDPTSTTVQRYIKTWATPAWKKWNAKNEASSL